MRGFRDHFRRGRQKLDCFLTKFIDTQVWRALRTDFSDIFMGHAEMSTKDDLFTEIKLGQAQLAPLIDFP